MKNIVADEKLNIKPIIRFSKNGKDYKYHNNIVQNNFRLKFLNFNYFK